MRWIEALKVWNAEHNPGKWCVAKKGSPEYDQVKAIMAKGKEHVKTGKGTKEMLEHLKAKKAAKESKKTDETDAVIAEMDEILKGSAKPAASAPKAPVKRESGFPKKEYDYMETLKGQIKYYNDPENWAAASAKAKADFFHMLNDSRVNFKEVSDKIKDAMKRWCVKNKIECELDKLGKKAEEIPSVAPKAPSRDVAGEMALIHQIAAAHAKKYGEESEKKKKVMAFLKAAAAHIKERRLAREAAAKPAPRATSPPRAPRRGQPDTRSRSTAPVKGRVEMSASEKEAAKARLYHNIANTEEVLRDLQARIRNPNFTVVQRNNMEMQEFKLLRIIAKMRKQVAAL